ncbi:hypothetical protein [Nocardiopsis gilva]|uniref:hypothetical protein n=1 Tax=Nocardiopsis gilva TaxID=280236 RepID=UPI0012FD34F0|nr:hypothetical protein [Nocardiopsis gilva]
MYIQLTNPDLSQGWDGSPHHCNPSGLHLQYTGASSLLEATFVPAADYRCIAISTDGRRARQQHHPDPDGTGLAWRWTPPI